MQTADFLSITVLRYFLAHTVRNKDLRNKIVVQQATNQHESSEAIGSDFNTKFVGTFHPFDRKWSLSFPPHSPTPFYHVVFYTANDITALF